MYQFFFAHLAKIQQNKERDESAKASRKARPPQEGAAVATGTSRSFHVLRPLRVAKPHELTNLIQPSKAELGKSLLDNREGNQFVSGW